MWILISVAAVFALSAVVFLNTASFGRTPRGERLERVKNSPNYRDGKFQNLHETKQITTDDGFINAVLRFLKKAENLRPKNALPAVRTNFHELDQNKDLLVWFGHSSYMLQTDGVRFLIDPVFSKAASPVPFFNKSFKMAEEYKPEDMPAVDYLIISHDHWDHLDYETVMKLKEKIGKIICGLGVGEHFERWGFEKSSIIELDWNEQIRFENGLSINCLPSRHFSGRGARLLQSLWASFLIESPTRKIYIGGDGGYDTHFAEMGNKFENIDLAILENGQYGKDWKYIHLQPKQVVQAFKDLNAKRLFTVHHSKYVLANHPWDEPLRNITAFAERDSINLIQPMIGEVVSLNDTVYTIRKWWEMVE